jgi:hypothetical protein
MCESPWGGEVSSCSMIPAGSRPLAGGHGASHLSLPQIPPSTKEWCEHVPPVRPRRDR